MTGDRQLDLLLDQWEAAQQRGEELSSSQLCQDCPELEPELTRHIHALRATGWMLDAEGEDEIDYLPLPSSEAISAGLIVPASVTLDQFTTNLCTSRLLDESELSGYQAATAGDLAAHLLRERKLTKYQAQQVATGNTQGLVLGNYVILDKIGAGGMGQVFKARHVRMDRIVALKVLPPESVNSQAAIDRFHREVKAAAKLEHPNIVTAHDADEFDGQHFEEIKDLPRTSYRFMAWSPSGKYIAAAGSAQPTRVWSVPDSQLVFEENTDNDHAEILWHPKQDTLAFLHKSVGLWDADANILTSGMRPVWSFFWLPDGSLVTDDSATTYVWDWKNKVQFMLNGRHVNRTLAHGTYSADGEVMLTVAPDGILQFRSTQTWQPIGVVIPVTEDARVAISADGHYRANDAAKGLIYYVVQTDSGQITLSPKEFAEKHGWKNDSSKVQLTGTRD